MNGHPITPNEQILAYVVYGTTGIVLHLMRQFIDRWMSITMLLAGMVGWMFGFYVASTFTTIAFRDFVALVCLYSIFLFVLLSEFMLIGLSHRLTSWRGEKWTKEIDYFYIALAGVGLLASINKLTVISDRVEFPDVYGPLVIATALVLRTIKARAEINNWNKRQ